MPVRAVNEWPLRSLCALILERPFRFFFIKNLFIKFPYDFFILVLLIQKNGIELKILIQEINFTNRY